MKRLISTLFIVIFISSVLSAKPYTSGDENEKSKLFYFGFGIGIGIFSPEDINNYMTDYYGNVDQSFGTFDMIAYYPINVTGSFFFTKYTELQLETELAYSPKIVMVNNNSEFFSYTRFTPDLKFNFHIPFSKKFSYFIGSGASYNFLSFKSPEEKYTGETFGFSVQTGVMIRFRKIAIQPGFTMNFVNADVDEYNETLDGFPTASLKELSYTGGQIGCKVMF
jgi:hypothetical protein